MKTTHTHPYIDKNWWFSIRLVHLFSHNHPSLCFQPQWNTGPGGSLHLSSLYDETSIVWNVKSAIILQLGWGPPHRWTAGVVILYLGMLKYSKSNLKRKLHSTLYDDIDCHLWVSSAEKYVENSSEFSEAGVRKQTIKFSRQNASLRPQVD